MEEGQRRDDPQRPVEARAREHRVDGRSLRTDADRDRDQLQVFVRLAGAGFGPGVVEAQSLALGHAQPEGLEVLQGEQALLLLEASGDDQQVVVEDVELVQQAEVRLRQLCDEELAIVGEEGIRAAALLLRGGLLLPPQLLDDPHHELDPALRVQGELEGGRYRAQHPAPLRPSASLAHRFEERAGLEPHHPIMARSEGRSDGAQEPPHPLRSPGRIGSMTAC